MWRVGTHVSDGVECRPGWTKRIQLDRTTAGDGPRAGGWSVRRKPNRDRRVAPQGRTRYFLLQPSLPLNQATWLGASCRCKLPGVPFSHFFLPVLLAFFLCRVFLPFAIVGRTLRTPSMSSAVHARNCVAPTRWTGGAGIFLAAMYRLIAV